MNVLRTGRKLHLLRRAVAQARQYTVCIADPRMVLSEPSAALQDATKGLVIDVPDAFVERLTKGELSLGEADDPENSWTFGKKGELFQMTFVGSVDAASGFVSILPASEVQRLRDATVATRPSWQDLKRLLDTHDVRWPQEEFPFLFVGHILEADSASVFQLKTSNEVDGLQITSNA